MFLLKTSYKCKFEERKILWLNLVFHIQRVIPWRIFILKVSRQIPKDVRLLQKIIDVDEQKRSEIENKMEKDGDLFDTSDEIRV